MNKRRYHFERTGEEMCGCGEEKSYTFSSKPCKTVLQGVQDFSFAPMPKPTPLYRNDIFLETSLAH